LFGKILLLLLLFVPISLAPIYAETPNHSIHFDDSDDVNFILKGTNTITNQENSSYQLNGFGDYMIIESNLPEKLNDFSISIWINPDFKIGAPATLSIISESNAFDLSINNDKVDKNVAVFSVYDGIKWHKVQSKSVISESWTHLSATYSDNQIKIFVNGIQENSQTIDSDYSMTHQYGTSIQNSYDYISSKSNVIVGAFFPLLIEDHKAKNYFSGQIDDIILYDTILSQDQISTLYQNDRVSYKPILQKIEQSVSNTIGVSNIYGFVADPNNPNDQRIEELSFDGYKIKKSSSGNNISTISETSKNISKTPFGNTDNQSNILEHEKQLVNEISEEIDNSGGSVKLCHVNGNGNGVTYTFPKLSLSSLNHLDHGDSLGDCAK
jgi:hypothetical protein